MKKRLISLVACVVLLGGLAAAYYFASANKPPEEEKPGFTSSSTQVLTRTRDEVTKVTFTAENHKFEFVPNIFINSSGREEFKWDMVGAEDYKYNKSNVDNMVQGAYTLSVSEVFMEKAENLKEYGLDKPKVTAVCNYKDGSSSAVYIGNITPGRDYYYAMIEGDERMFLLLTITGNRFLYTMNDLLDKTLPELQTEMLQYIHIKEKDGMEVEFDFIGTEEEKQKQLESYGYYVAKMIQPYYDRELYTSNFEMYVLEDLKSISLIELVETAPIDYAKYGLDEPSLEIHLADTANELHLLIGADAGNDMYYCKLYDRPHVFTVRQAYLEDFFNINPLGFVDRFYALIYINTVDSFEIKTKDNSYEIELNREFLPPKEGEEEGEEILKPTVNGRQVQADAFRKFYSSVIGLSQDSEIEEFTPTGTPEITITYKTNTGMEYPMVRLYNYNSDFYAAQRNDYPITFVTSKHNVKIIFDTMDDLMAGKLNK